MKRMILIIFAALLLVGCGEQQGNAKEENYVIERIRHDVGGISYSQVYYDIVRDNETGREYIVAITAHGISITPRLQKEIEVRNE